MFEEMNIESEIKLDFDKATNLSQTFLQIEDVLKQLDTKILDDIIHNIGIQKKYDVANQMVEN